MQKLSLSRNCLQATYQIIIHTISFVVAVPFRYMISAANTKDGQCNIKRVVKEFYLYTDTENMALAEVTKLNPKSVARISNFFRFLFHRYVETTKTLRDCDIYIIISVCGYLLTLLYTNFILMRICFPQECRR
jgi:hypothetical protein